MEDGEYLRRLSGCLMNHYRGSMEIHIFTDVKQLAAAKIIEFGVFLMGDFDPDMPELREIPRNKILYLVDSADGIVEGTSENDGLEEDAVDKVTPDNSGIFRISKYEEVPRMVDTLGMLTGNKELKLNQEGDNSSCVRLYGVYSLHVPHMQLPFIIALGDILSEQNRVLVVDLQENSGLAKEELSSGMEDVMAMAKTQKYTRGRLISAIGHFNQWDYIYPVRNSECLCEGDYELYRSLLQMVEKEMSYDVIILNFGPRFQGFFRLMWDCGECFLLGEENKKGWREEAFYEEIQKRRDQDALNKLIWMDIPAVTGKEISPQSIAQQWMWNEPKDVLRNILSREKYCG